MKNRIEAIRKERGIRQEDFAKSMGVSRQTISSLETGRYNPSIFLAYKIARYFEMTIEEVFIFEEEDLKQEGNVMKYSKKIWVSGFWCVVGAVLIALCKGLAKQISNFLLA